MSVSRLMTIEFLFSSDFRILIKAVNSKKQKKKIVKKICFLSKSLPHALISLRGTFRSFVGLIHKVCCCTGCENAMLEDQM